MGCLLDTVLTTGGRELYSPTAVGRAHFCTTRTHIFSCARNASLFRTGWKGCNGIRKGSCTPYAYWPASRPTRKSTGLQVLTICIPLTYSLELREVEPTSHHCRSVARAPTGRPWRSKTLPCRAMKNNSQRDVVVPGSQWKHGYLKGHVDPAYVTCRSAPFRSMVLI